MNPIDSLKAKAREWAAKVVALSNTDVPPELAQEKQKLMNWAKIIKDMVEKVFGTMDEFEQIGAIPLIVPAAAIAAAAAAITKWTIDYKKFMKKVMLQKDLIASGSSPEQAARTIAALENKSQLLGTLTNKVALPILGLGILLHFVRK